MERLQGNERGGGDNREGRPAGKLGGERGRLQGNERGDNREGRPVGKLGGGWVN